MTSPEDNEGSAQGDSVAGSAIDPANFGPVVVITLCRIYDVLMAQLSTANPAMAKNLAELHEAGVLLGPPPAIEVSEEQEQH